MDYVFYLNDTQIDEPIGWEDFELSMNRDDKTHGMQFEASTNTLRFYGSAANYLRSQEQQFGIKAQVVLVAQQFCDDPYTPVEEITGKLNFGKFKERCGDQCIIELPLEEDSCRVVLKTRYDQKVDLDKLVAFDGMTPLAGYAQLGQELTLKAKALQAAVDGSVAQDGYSIQYDGGNPLGGSLHWFRPSYDVQRYNNIATGQLQPFQDYQCNGGCLDLGPISPQLLMEDTIECFGGNFEYNIRNKGVLTITGGGSVFHIKTKIIKWDGVGNIFDDGDVVQEQTLFDGLPSPPVDPVIPFDGTVTGTVALPDGISLYAIVEVGMSASTFNILIEFDRDTYFTLTAVKLCPDTQVQYYLVHETLSRIAESITNNCVRVKSSYYGRTDSQPFSFDADGCGGLRMLTSGLKIRRAPDGKFFASLKDIFEGLNNIDNIGFDLADDPDNAGKLIMNVEPIDYFYRNQQVFIITNIPRGVDEMQEQMHYSKILVGYKKWQVEGVNGLDEFNSTREYRTTFLTNNTLDITSSLVAGSYPIEVTRQQNFADSGAADTKFDDDIFIITLQRQVYDFEVEQDNVSSAANFFDPDTIYNFKLSPLRNLMRWYKTIAAGYTSLYDSDNKLFFSAGTGNLLATGEVITGAYDADCKIEALPITENQNIFTTHFAIQVDYTPLWKPKIFTFEYPLSISEYNKLKLNPYGYITCQCGNGDIKDYFIKEIRFRPAKGRATFALLKKWD